MPVLLDTCRTQSTDKYFKIYKKNSFNSLLNFFTLINVYIISVCVFFVTPIWAMKYDISITMKKNLTVTQTVSDKFLSFGLDASLLRKIENLPLTNQTFLNFASYLSPAYVRFGGTAADCLYFNQTETKKLLEKNTNLSSVSDEYDSNDISNFTITSSDFFSLYNYTKKAGIRMMFDLNTLLRNTDGSWNSDNAKEIINFAKDHRMKIDWQMGNEPNSFRHVFNVTISAKQLAKDYCKLRSILNKSGYKKRILVGPEANHIGDESNRGEKYVKNFLENNKDCIDYVTWHQYYLNGHIAQVDDFINTTVFEKLPEQIQTMKRAIDSSGSNISMWLSETSSAYGSGAPNISDKFVAGFLWLDKLGISAKEGVQVVVRQSLYGGHYAMIGNDLKPNPDWWISVLYKKFVSPKVLNLEIPSNLKSIRFYAHCSLTTKKRDSSIVIYGMNLNDKQTNIFIRDLPKHSKIFSYSLTSDYLQSRNIFMNGKILKLTRDGRLPQFKAKIIDRNEYITLLPRSLIFLIINGTQIPACFKW